MKVTRTFYKTGQALFAVERITCHNQQRTIVYDCGGNNVNEVKRAINAIKDVKVIDAVFISHYHTDHINGLRELLKSFPVKNLFLPLLDPLQELAIRCTSPNYQKHKLYDNPKQFLATEGVNLPKIHMVKVEGEGTEEVNLQETSMVKVEDEGTEPNDNPQKSVNPQIYLGNDGFDSVIPSGTEIDFQFLDDAANNQKSDSYIPCWRLIPFNLTTMSLQEWICFLKIIGLDEKLTPQQVKENWKDIKLSGKNSPVHAIEKIFGWGFEEVNEHSMTLYSGPTLKNQCSLSECKGCLYYGDFNAKRNGNMNKLKKRYMNYWSNIRVVQVPHHGSDKNFDAQVVVPGATHVIPNDDSLSSCKSTRKRYSRYASPHNINDFIKNNNEKVYLVYNDLDV